VLHAMWCGLQGNKFAIALYSSTYLYIVISATEFLHDAQVGGQSLILPENVGLIFTLLFN